MVLLRTSCVKYYLFQVDNALAIGLPNQLQDINLFSILISQTIGPYRLLVLEILLYIKITF